jgi:hypothetical protein
MHVNSCRKIGLMSRNKWHGQQRQSSGVSANRLHGFGRVMLPISQTGRFAALDARGEAMTPVDTASYARRYVRAPGPITLAGSPAPDGMAVDRSHPPW